MKIINECKEVYECKTFVYDAADELMEHERTMRKNGWEWNLKDHPNKPDTIVYRRKVNKVE